MLLDHWLCLGLLVRISVCVILSVHYYAVNRGLPSQRGLSELLEGNTVKSAL